MDIENYKYGIYFVLGNLLFGGLLYIFRNKKSPLSFKKMRVVMIGDYIGLSIVNFFVGIALFVNEIEIVSIWIGILFGLIIALLIEVTCRHNSLRRQGIGYVDGVPNINGRLHFWYALIQGFLVYIALHLLFTGGVINSLFIVGIVLYIFSLFLDLKTGVFQ